MESLVANLLAKAASQPAAPAYIDGIGVLTYRELAAAAGRAAASLAQRGARAGEPLALVLEESTDEAARRSLFLFYGAAWLGAPVLPLYPEVPAPDREPLMQRYGARLRFGAADFDAALEHRAPPRGDGAEADFLFHFSSGTTGEPKALLFRHGQFAAMLAAGAAADCWAAADRLVTGRPWPSKVALRYVGRLHSVGGAIVRRTFPRTRARLAQLIRDLGVTGICGSPAAMRELLASPAPAGGLPPLRVLRVSGAATTPGELRALRSEITPNVHFSYGSTEVGVIASLRPGEPVGDPVTLGVVASGLAAEVVGEDDAPLATGAVGRLRYRTPWMPSGYVGNPAATERHFRNGWFYPGDLGSIDAAGRIALHGRTDDLINFRGVKILPQDVVPALLRHPGVEDAVLLGVPHPQFGELPVAFFVPRGPVDIEALRRYCKEQCGDLRTPARFHPVKRLPRNSAGKIERERLIARFQELLELHSSPPRGTPSSRKP